MTRIDALLKDPRWAPFSGYHDNHRHVCETPAYLPAMMQVRDELLEFAHVIEALELHRSCLQLGLGRCEASHEVWRLMFDRVLTIDLSYCIYSDMSLSAQRSLGLDTRSSDALALAQHHGPYDLLFIDAGHSFEDVRSDYVRYKSLVRPGGLIAFHDALERDGYPEVEVHRLLASLPDIKMIGSEVGIGWTRRGISIAT